MNSLVFLAREMVRAVWLIGRHVVESRRPVYEQGDWLDGTAVNTTGRNLPQCQPPV